VFLGDGIVEDEKERDEKRWGNHHGIRGLKRISCASQLIIPDTAGTSPTLECNYTDTMSS